MLLVMWTVAPNGWFRGDAHAPADLPAGTARPDDTYDGMIRTTGFDHAETDDHGACSLPRHTIRERID
jgi:hypothetical protein